MFVDCYSRYTILVPASNHTAITVSDALLRHVIPYFGTPRRLLSDRGCEFMGDVWGKLMRSLGIQHVLTSPYHPEGNAGNERSHRTMNNMLRARLLEGTSFRAWMKKVPGLMLALNAMVHEPHGFSASMGSLLLHGRYPRPPERRLRFSLSRRSHGLCRGVEAASFAHPPADDCPTAASFCQSAPRGESHLRDDDSPRARKQADS